MINKRKQKQEKCYLWSLSPFFLTSSPSWYDARDIYTLYIYINNFLCIIYAYVHIFYTPVKKCKVRCVLGLDNLRACCPPWEWEPSLELPLRHQTLIFRYPCFSSLSTIQCWLEKMEQFLIISHKNWLIFFIFCWFRVVCSTFFSKRKKMDKHISYLTIFISRIKKYYVYYSMGNFKSH